MAGNDAFPPELRDILPGNPWGEVFPPRRNPSPLAVDGRTIALSLLRKYISLLTFYRAGGIDPATGVRGEPIPFKIPDRNIHIEWPDQEKDLEFPSVVFMAEEPAVYAAIGLNSYIEEDSKDVYGKGMVVQWQSEYTENFQIEIWASKKAERRAILAGLEIALSPTEQMYGIRFKMKDYFGQAVCFTLGTRQIFDEPDAARDRRRARLGLEMRFNTVALVNINSLNTLLTTEVDACDGTGEALDFEVDNTPPARDLGEACCGDE